MGRMVLRASIAVTRDKLESAYAKPYFSSGHDPAIAVHRQRKKSHRSTD